MLRSSPSLGGELMFKGILLSTVLLFSGLAQAQNSAVRDLNEDWMTAAEKNLGSVASPMFVGATAYSASKPYFDADWDDMVEVSDMTTIETAFYMVRDIRFLQNRVRDGFLRRITWLYPDDGCYARAALMKGELDQVQVPVSRIFIFGDLQVMSENHPSGKVGWWYHTAPIMKTANGDIYVLDPAIDALRPLRVDEWVLRQVPALDLASISICDGTTYGPGSACDGGVDPAGMAKSDISTILDAEWRRQIQLQRQPEVVLGDMPPWSMITEVAVGL